MIKENQLIQCEDCGRLMQRDKLNHTEKWVWINIQGEPEKDIEDSYVCLDRLDCVRNTPLED